jgi:uncharacterized protein YqjF (DUF2071 family)
VVLEPSIGTPRRPFLTAEWRDLAMISFEADPAALGRRVPRGTEIDAWEGRTFITIVGLRFARTRVLGLPIPFHRDFDEVNLRFYVRRKGPEGWRRGVVFVKEIVSRAAVAWVARAVYGENYAIHPVRHEIRLPAAGGPEKGEVAYAWRAGGRWNRLEVAVEGEPGLPDGESEETFIAEHYWGYTRCRDGSALEYRVEHPPWRVWRSVHARLDCAAEAVYGPELCGFLTGPPVSAFVAEGSAIVVRRGVRIA